ncbi:FAD dependent oxidoreductase [Agrocybe pediades]|nr:FAD dependent oxidoreductase [Agrocybe pediades]
MGSVFSTVRIVLKTFKEMMQEYDAVSKRISQSPGIPQLNASIPYWTIPNSPIAHEGSNSELPLEVDIVILGSGITGASVAKALLEYTSSTDGRPPRIAMLEARDACSGATGRNGGHASPIIYNEYAVLKKEYGAATAIQILRFRIAHITGLITAARDANILDESQARIVDDFDAFLHPQLFEKYKRLLDVFLKEAPEDVAETFDVVEERNAIEKLQLASSVIGLIIKPGASIHSYRFVTGVLARLLDKYSNFQLFTRTPCTNITVDRGIYVVSTPRGQIRARHVIHATNAWSSHLLPGLRRKIVPVRAHMSAQRPGQGLSRQKPIYTCDNSSGLSVPWAGSRAFVFYPGTEDHGYEYLTQLLPAALPQNPPSPSRSTSNNSGDTLTDDTKRLPLPTAGEFMFGGGAMLGGQSETALMNALGVADDSDTDFVIESYLGGALERYFGKHWGEEGNEPDTEESNPPGGEWGKGRAKAFWTGIIGISADSVPWVGRVPSSVSGRQEPKSSTSETMLSSETKAYPTASPGEWISAGYSGEGMVHAWLCGRAVARMVLGISAKHKGELDLPEPFLITEQRVKKAKIEDLLDRVGE